MNTIITRISFFVWLVCIVSGQNTIAVSKPIATGTTTTTIITGSTFKVAPGPNGVLINGTPTNSYKLIINGQPVIFTSENGLVNVNGNPINAEPGSVQTMNFNGVIFTFTKNTNNEVTVTRKNAPKEVITINTIQPTPATTTPTMYVILFNNEYATVTTGENGVVFINGEQYTILPGQTTTITINGKPATVELGPGNVVIINKESVTSNGQTIPDAPKATIYTIYFNDEIITVSREGNNIVIINGVSYTVPDGQTITISINRNPVKVSINSKGEVVLDGKTVTENMQKINSPKCYETILAIFNDAMWANLSRGDDTIYINGVPISAPKGKEIVTMINGYPEILEITNDNKLLANRQPVIGWRQMIYAKPVAGGTEYNRNINGRNVLFTLDPTNRLFVDNMLINAQRGQTLQTGTPGVSVTVQSNGEVYISGVKLVAPNGVVAKTEPLPRGPPSPFKESNCPPGKHVL